MITVNTHCVPVREFEAEVIHHCDRRTGLQSEWLVIRAGTLRMTVFPQDGQTVRGYLEKMQACVEKEDAYQFDRDMAKLRAEDISNGVPITADPTPEPPPAAVEVPF